MEKEKPYIFFSIDRGRICANLMNADSAPNRRWDRAQTGTSQVFYRELTANEACHLLSDNTLPKSLPQVSFSLSPEILNIKVKNVLYEPGVVIRESSGKFRSSISFRHPSRNEWLIPKNPKNLTAESNYLVDENFLIAFPEEQLLAIKETFEMASKEHTDWELELSFRQHQQFLTNLKNQSIYIQEDFSTQQYLEKLYRNLKGKKNASIPAELHCNLYPYQQEGLAWLQFCYQNELGCLLADDMGLGKTVTAIALLASVSSEKSPALVICPATLVANWEIEFQKFCPTLSVACHHGANRSRRMEDYEFRDVVITTYDTVRNDVVLLEQFYWNAVIMDEAQQIKNPESARSAACRQLATRCPIAMTGTPFENRPLDLWSLMDFLAPGFLGSQKNFLEQYAQPIHAGSDQATTKLENIIQLFMLRRLKKDVRNELPEKIEIDQALQMSPLEADGYRHYISTLKQSPIQGKSILGSLTSLRQLCCHPSLKTSNRYTDPFIDCTKYQRLIEILGEIIEAEEKALLFAPFVKMLDIFQRDLPERLRVPVHRIDGSVPIENRQPIIEKFSDIKGSAVMILNPKAAGIGLNIVAANHVIHYGREWNPAIENQATDRAYRIGQKENVMVHYLYYLNTIDELISTRLRDKSALSDDLIKPTENKTADQELLLTALNLIPTNKS